MNFSTVFVSKNLLDRNSDNVFLQEQNMIIKRDSNSHRDRKTDSY